MENELAKIRIFIGSSSEARNIVNKLSVILGREGFSVKIWNHETFHSNDNYFESIKREMILADYSIFVVNPDDEIVKRGERIYATRDNVLLEIGMFIGFMSIKKVFCLRIIDNRNGVAKEVILPSDLSGNEYLKVTLSNSDERFSQELRDICTTIKELILQLENMSNIRIGMLPSESLAIGYFNNFLKPVCTKFMGDDPIPLFGNRIFDPNRDEFEFNVVLPDDLSDVEISAAKILFRGEKFKKIVITGEARSFPFYIDAEQNINLTKLYDYPTTLGSSKQAIDEAIKDEYYTNDQKELLKSREIRNFQRTLKIMLDEHGRVYRNKVKFIFAKKFRENHVSRNENIY